MKKIKNKIHISFFGLLLLSAAPSLSEGRLSSFQGFNIVTKNKSLQKRLQLYFKNRPVSQKEIQKFLIRNSYYQADIIKEENNYIIKNPFQVIFLISGNKFFNERQIRNLIYFEENKYRYDLFKFIELSIKKKISREGFFKSKH